LNGSRLAHVTQSVKVPARGRATWWYPALAGVAAVATALGIGELVAAAVDSRSSPLASVSSLVIDTGRGGKELAINLFGTNDKLAILSIMVALLCLIGAGIALLARRWWWVRLAGPGALGALAIVAALTRAGASPAWALPGLFAAAAGAGLLAWLLTQLDRAAAEHVATYGRVPGDTGERSGGGYGDGPSRRRFLQASAVAVVFGAIGGWIGHRLGQASAVSDARRQVATVLPTPSGGAAPDVAGSDVADLHYVTANSDFYRVDTTSFDVYPQVDPATWSLTIDGRVANPMQITFDQLLARPMIERYITLACVSNPVGGPYIGNAKWLGVPVKDLLQEAGPDPDADQVVSWSVDGFTAGTPTAALLDGRDALIAVAMNGEPLPVEHGFPVRMVVPGLYGYVSATKWLQRLQLTRFSDFNAYWVATDPPWAQQAPIKTESRIDRPGDGQTLNAGDIVVAGVAWAQHRGISQVQVQVDNGPWNDATLASVASIDTWRLWSWHWQATPGSHSLRVRAADNSGAFQTDQVVDVLPDGATGYHQISVTIH
jgi:DMSO/TMAO reductase YedYZ molybdopterin-dependent catalytic subunit